MLTSPREDAWATRLADLQVRRPVRFILVAAALAALSVPFVLELGLNGDFTALLPEHKASVQDLDEIRDRFGRQSTLTVAVEAKTSTDARAFVAALAPKLEALEAEKVSAVDWNVSAFVDFVEKHRHLYAPLEDLEEIRDVLSDRLSFELGKANPLYVDLAARDDAPPDPKAVLERLEAKAEEARARAGRFPGGYFQHPDRPLVVLFIRTSIQGGEIDQVNRLLAAVDREVAALDPARFGRGGVEVSLGGELMDIKEEQEALTRAVLLATLITVILVLLSIYLFYFRLRSIPILGLAVTPPLLLTFALAEVMVDSLNASSAFLASIVLGNGINPFIIWLSRYFESRREGRESRDAMADTHEATWAATLTASAAAGIAYGSLIITDFKGFKDFGLIGGAGMAFCWAGAFLLLPCLVALAERWVPWKRNEAVDARAGSYGRVFSWLAIRHPRAVVVTSVAMGIASVAVIGLALRRSPMEYDFRNLQSQRPLESRTQWVNDRQGEIVDETTTGSAIAILVKEGEDVERVRAQLERYRAETSSTAFGAVRTLSDLLPDRQAEKIEVLDEISDILPKLKKHASEEERRLLDENAPPLELEVLEPSDLPDDITRYFREKDGSLGKIVFLEHHVGSNNWDGEYLVRWADAARSVRLADGGRPAVAGQPPVFADLLAAIWVDGPRAVAAALGATGLLLVVTFRRWNERVHTLGALLLGVLWMSALMALADIKLNFLNFVAFPITFGNGVDYGVNVMRRYVLELEGNGGDRLAAARAAVEGTGGAVVLCSLTTVVGYISLYTSTNRALNTFGAAMSISEITCVLAGVLTLPAVLVLGAQRARK